MTLNELREDLKAAHEAYLNYRVRHVPDDILQTHPRGFKNMREMYVFAKSMTTTSKGKIPEYYKVLIALVKAGDVYYHAKKYGIDSAILFKLSAVYP